jgi:hypothetical protein
MQYRGQDRVRKLNNVRGSIGVTMTDAQRDPLGLIVGHLYYSNRILSDLLPSFVYENKPAGAELSSSGYPHNGGEHTMEIYGPKADVVAFLELAADFYEVYAMKRPDFAPGAAMVRTLSHLAATI